MSSTTPPLVGKFEVEKVDVRCRKKCFAPSACFILRAFLVYLTCPVLRVLGVLPVRMAEESMSSSAVRRITGITELNTPSTFDTARCSPRSMKY